MTKCKTFWNETTKSYISHQHVVLEMFMHHYPASASEQTVKHKTQSAQSTDSEGIIVRLLTNCSFDVTTDKCLWNIFTVSFLPLSFCEVMILWFKLHRTILRTNIRKEWGITDEIQERPCLKCFNVVISRSQVHYFIILRKWALLSWDNEKINLLPQENKRRCALIS